MLFNVVCHRSDCFDQSRYVVAIEEFFRNLYFKSFTPDSPYHYQNQSLCL